MHSLHWYTWCNKLKWSKHIFISLHLLHHVYQFRECRNKKQTLNLKIIGQSNATSRVQQIQLLRSRSVSTRCYWCTLLDYPIAASAHGSASQQLSLLNATNVNIPHTASSHSTIGGLRGLLDWLHGIARQRQPFRRFSTLFHAHEFVEAQARLRSSRVHKSLSSL